MDLVPFSRAGQVIGSVGPNGKGELMASKGGAEQEPEPLPNKKGLQLRW